MVCLARQADPYLKGKEENLIYSYLHLKYFVMHLFSIFLLLIAVAEA